MSTAPVDPARPTGLAWLLAAEVLSGALGFVATVHLARHLGLDGFGVVEYAAAVSAWLLILVRGGIEVVVLREAARRPRLVAPLTELLLGLKLACAGVGYAIVLAIAVMADPNRGRAVALAGLTLLPSALSADVGPRALGRLGAVATFQVMRICAYAGIILLMVSRHEHALRAIGAAIAAETVAAALFAWSHLRHYGVPRPRFRARAWTVLARRGLAAGLSRFARVGLYAADLLVLGSLASPELGRYAAARRVVFAMVALGLVVPSALGPALGRAWAIGPEAAASMIGRATARLVLLALPASIGLAMVADRIMPALFGERFRAAGPWLVLVALRLVPLLLGSLHASALVACRRERESLALLLGMGTLAVVLLPAAGWWQGARGVGLALLAIEWLGAAGGWALLRRRHAAPPWHHFALGPATACLFMIVACKAAKPWPLPMLCALGALVYAAALAPIVLRRRSPFATGEIHA